MLYSCTRMATVGVKGLFGRSACYKLQLTSTAYIQQRRLRQSPCCRQRSEVGPRSSGNDLDCPLTYHSRRSGVLQDTCHVLRPGVSQRLQPTTRDRCRRPVDVDRPSATVDDLCQVVAEIQTRRPSVGWTDVSASLLWTAGRPSVHVSESRSGRPSWASSPTFPRVLRLSSAVYTPVRSNLQQCIYYHQTGILIHRGEGPLQYGRKNE